MSTEPRDELALIIARAQAVRGFQPPAGFDPVMGGDLRAADAILSSDWLAAHDREVAATERERIATWLRSGSPFHDVRNTEAYWRVSGPLAQMIREGRTDA